MHERMQTRKAKIMKKLRHSTVEPVLGTLLNFMNMRRVNTRGIDLANKHVLLAATVYNLKKYMNYIQRGARAAAMEAIRTTESKLLLFVFAHLAQLMTFLCLKRRNSKLYIPNFI